MGHTALNVGDVVAERFAVVSVMGQSALGTTCLVSDSERQSKFLLKSLSFELSDEDAQEVDALIQKLQRLEHRSISTVRELVRDQRGAHIISEYVDGDPLGEHLQLRRQRGQILGHKAAYSMLAHLSSGLERLHHEGLYYAALSTESIFVTKQGRVKVASPVFGYLAERFLSDEGRGLYFSSTFIAPEVRNARQQACPQSDVYSLALLFVELLSPVSLVDFRGELAQFVDGVDAGAAVKQCLSLAIAEKYEMRYNDLASFKDDLKSAVDAPADGDLSSIVLNVSDLRALTGVSDSAPAARKPDLFDRADNRSVKRTTRSAKDSENWIYKKNNLDYGPFTHAGILEKLHADEINESTPVLDVSTQKRAALGKIPEFEAEVAAYLPIREKRRADAFAASVKKKETIKKASTVTIVAIVLISAVVIGGLLYVISLLPDPEPLNLNAAFPPFENVFELPKMEEISLNVDESKAKALFDPKASAEEREAAFAAWEAEHRKRFASRRKAAGKGPGSAGGMEDEMFVISFDGPGADLPPLLDWEVEEQLLSPRSMRKQSECFMNHGGGRSQRITANFVITQNGTVRNATTNASGALNDCLLSIVQSLKFRAFGGSIKKVSYPMSYN
ncbi:MAG: protein kinase domain-containing protein [Bradymonadia bacterium]|jgi:serine/threonine protein kinase